MRHYRCYFLIDDKIKAAEDIGAKDDADALLRAEELLAGSSFSVIEVWHAERLVARLQPRTISPTSTKAKHQILRRVLNDLMARQLRPPRRPRARHQPYLLSPATPAPQPSL